MKKKILVLAAAAAGGVLAVRKSRHDRQQADLWAEATDPVKPSR